MPRQTSHFLDRLERMVCRIRAALRNREARAVVARMSTLELRDIGLSHADALPALSACCE
jgi:uncharacterized protein YjiS (DUF1127 family)